MNGQIEFDDKQWAYVQYGAMREREAFKRFLREQVRQHRDHELNDSPESYRKQSAEERRHYQRVLREFNEWCEARTKKAKRR